MNSSPDPVLSPEPVLSIVLNVMGRVELAEYGFRSWMLQETGQPYEVVLNLFNDRRKRFETLAERRNPACLLRVNSYERPAFFNISVANNLGIHSSSGRYVMFAGADMIYLSRSVRLVEREVAGRDIAYAVGYRWDLTPRQAPLNHADRYTLDNNFDTLSKLETRELYVTKTWGQGWIVRRDIIRAIGGFDRRILYAEDKDLNDRVIHYLRRTGAQEGLHGLDVGGFHLWHPTSDILAGAPEATTILSARREQLLADPSTSVDVVSNELDSREALLQDLRRTERPPSAARYRRNPLKKVVRRMNRAYHALRGRL